MLKKILIRFLNFGIIKFFKQQFILSPKFDLIIDLAIPVFGVLILGWEFIIAYYFAEILIDGIFTIFKVFLASDNKRISNKFITALFYTLFFLFMNGIYSIFVLIFSLYFFNSRIFAIFLENYESQSQNYSWVKEILKIFWEENFSDFLLFIFIIYSLNFFGNYLFKKKYKKEKSDNIIEKYMQGRVVVFHISLIAIGFLIGIPNTFGNFLGYGFYKLTGFYFIFELFTRFSNAFAAIIFGFVAVWNKNRLRNYYGKRY